MIAFFYILVCGVLLLAWYWAMLAIRRFFKRSVTVVNTSLDEGLISSGFVANTAYIILFILIFRICLI